MLFSNKDEKNEFEAYVNNNLDEFDRLVSEQQAPYIESIYSLIYIDEVQDMAGDDLDLLALLFASKTKIVAVGDIRQAIYFTCNARKNKSNRGSKLLDYFRKLEKKGLLQIAFRDYSYRCKQSICDLSDSLFPNIDEKTSSLNNS